MKKILMILMALTLSITACGNSEETEAVETEQGTELAEDSKESKDNEKSETSEQDSKEKEVIKIGTNGPHLDIMNEAEKVIEANSDYEVELVVFDDVIQPNVALDEGSIDCNFFQHKPYLASYNEQHGTNLVPYGGKGVFKLQFGFYSNNIDSIDQLEDGDQITFGNDPSNRAIALKFLEELGLITLEEGVEQPDTINIVENPLNLQFTEMDVTSVVNSVEDPNVDGAIVMGFALARSGKDPSTALAYASGDLANEYVNVLAVREGDENSEWGQVVFDGLTSDEMAEFYDEYFQGAVKLLD